MTTQDHATATPTDPAAPASTEPLFNADEVHAFEEDDSTAGRVIGKMLALFFLYTVVAMALVSLWTWNNSFGE